MSEARTQLSGLLSKLDRAAEQHREAPPATPPVGHRRLCLGLATYDDFDGAWFTITSALMHQPEVAGDISFLVVDNHPEGRDAPALKALEQRIPGYRYVPFSGYRGTAVRDLVFREADADIVCCVDSHVLLRPGALRALLDYFETHPDSIDLVQGPLMSDDLTHVRATQLEPVWQSGMFGRWTTSSAAGPEAREVTAHGLGLFACRRDAWPGLNPRFRGFGGEEGYLHERVRQRGGRTLVLPALGWVHRFERPSGTPYAPEWVDRVRNYVIGWAEVGWDIAAVEEHFGSVLGAAAGPILDVVRRQVASPLMVFDAVFCLTERKDPSARIDTEMALRGLESDWRAEWITTTPGSSITDPSAWREILTLARFRGYESILVVDDRAGDVRLVEQAWARAEAAVQRLVDQSWTVQRLDLTVSDIDIGTGTGTTPPTIVAVHRRAYEALLTGLADDSRPPLPGWAAAAPSDRTLDQWGAAPTASSALDPV